MEVDNDIGKSIRRLGAASSAVDSSKLQLALALAENLLAVVTGVQAAREDANQSTASAECGPDFPSSTQLPYQVLATYYRTVLEWTVASLLKLKPPKPPAGNGSTKEQPNAAQQGQLPAEHVAYATHLMGLWGLLRMLLERGRPVRAVLREGGVPGSLLPAAAQSLRWMAGYHAGVTAPTPGAPVQPAGLLPLCDAIAVSLSLLAAPLHSVRGITGSQPLRPSLEHCTALLAAVAEVQHDACTATPTPTTTMGAAAAASGPAHGKRGTAGSRGAAGSGRVEHVEQDVHGTAGGHGAAAGRGVWARLCTAAVRLTHGSAQGHPVPRKVWQALVTPQLLLPLLQWAVVDVSAPPGDGARGELGGGGVAEGSLGATLRAVLGPEAAGAAFAAGFGGAEGGGGGMAAAAELSAAVGQLLAAVLFHESHVDALAEVMGQVVVRQADDGADGKAEGGKAAAAGAAGAEVAEGAEGGGGGGREDGGGDGSGAASAATEALLPGFAAAVKRSYTGQLLQVLVDAVWAADRSQSGPAAHPTPPPPHDPHTSSSSLPSTLLLAVPWLLRTYCSALARHRRILEADAAAGTAAAAAGGTSRRNRDATAPGAEAAGQEHVEAPGVGSRAAQPAAEFEAMVAMSYLLLQPPPPSSVQAAGGGGGGGGGKEGGRAAKRRKLAESGKGAVAPAAEGDAVGGGPGGAVGEAGVPAWRLLTVAAVLAAGKDVGAYQPTRDVTGEHRAVLAAIVREVIGLGTGARAEASAAGATGAGGAAAAGRASVGGVSEATSLALCAVLDLEHRVLVPHLPHMWALLWAAAGATPPRVHGFPREPTASAGTVATALTAHGSMGGAIAAAVLHRVVRAFSDLRQLRSLLESLSAALREGCGGGVGTCDGAVLGRLLCRGEVLAAVRQAAASAPPGQLASLMEWVADDLRLWLDAVKSPAAATSGASGAAGEGELLLAVGSLYDSLLGALRLDLTSAAPADAANRKLLRAVAEPLVSSLRAYGKQRAAVREEAGGSPGLQLCTARLAVLLQLYGSVVRVNATCASLHPQVVPLLGMGIAPGAESDSQDQALQDAGYLAAVFDAACRADGADAEAAAKDGAGDGGAAAAAVKAVRKALKRAGSTACREGLLQGLAQLVLPGGAAAGAAKSAGAAGAWAPEAAEARLATAVYRCCCHRMQVLHERSTRRSHALPRRTRAEVTAGAVPAPAPGGAEVTDQGDEAGELASLAALLLAPFSSAACADTGCNTEWHGSGSSPRAGAAGGVAAVAGGAAALRGMWGDLLSLMGCVGPWAQQQHLSQVLQLAVEAVVVAGCGRQQQQHLQEHRQAGVAAQAREVPGPRTPGPHAGVPSRGVGRQGYLGLFCSSSGACLRLLEYQSLQGVRQALPYAWAAAVGERLGRVGHAVVQLPGTAAANGVADREGTDATDGERRARKKARKSTPGKGAAEAEQLQLGGERAAGVLASRTRLAALGAEAAALGSGDGEQQPEGHGEQTASGGSSKKKLKTLLKEQAAAWLDLPSLPEQARGSGAAGAPAAGVGVDVDGAEQLHTDLEQLQLLLEALGSDGGEAGTGRSRGQAYGPQPHPRLHLHLDALPRRGLKAAGRQIVTAVAALAEAFALLKLQGVHTDGSRGSDGVGDELLQLRQRLVEAAAAGLGALRRLHAALARGTAEAEAGEAGLAAGFLGGLYDDPLDERLLGWLAAVSELLAAEGAGCDEEGWRVACAGGRRHQEEQQGDGTRGGSGELLCCRVVAGAGELLRVVLGGAETGPLQVVARRQLQQAAARASQCSVAGGRQAANLLACRLALAALAAAAEKPAVQRCAIGTAAGDGEEDAEDGGAGGFSMGDVQQLIADVGDAADGAVAAAAPTAAAGNVATGGPEAGSSPVAAALATRAALCSVACLGQLLLLLRPAAAAPAVQPGQSGHPSAGQLAPPLQALAPGLPQLLRRACGWLLQSRQLEDRLGCNQSSGSASACGAAVSLEPLAHCLGLVCGVAHVLPCLPRAEAADNPSGAAGSWLVGHGRATQLVSGSAAAGGDGGGRGCGEVTSDGLLMELVAILQALMAEACEAHGANAGFPAAGGPGGSIWNVLLAGTDPSGPAGHSRRLLLESFRRTMAVAHPVQLDAVLRHVSGELTRGSLYAPSPAALLPPLHCLLLCLESPADARATRVLASHGRSLTVGLTEVVAAVGCAGAFLGEDEQQGSEVAEAGVAPWAASGPAFCAALRCLESILGREATFRSVDAPLVVAALSAVVTAVACSGSSQLLRPPALATAVRQAVAACRNPAARVQSCVEAVQRAVQAQQYVYDVHVACCGLMTAAVRHHAAAVSTAMAALVEGARALLRCLEAWAVDWRRMQQLLRGPGAAAAGGVVLEAAGLAAAASAAGLGRCALALARVYDAVSEHPKTLGKYGIHVLADYVVHAATPLASLVSGTDVDQEHELDRQADPWVVAASGSSTATATTSTVSAGSNGATYTEAGASPPALGSARESSGLDSTPLGAVAEEEYALWVGAGGAGGVGGGGGRGGDATGTSLLPSAAHQGLRQGAFRLLSCLGAPQLQHLHMALGGGVQGAARRGALGQLRKEYEASFKYSGKV